MEVEGLLFKHPAAAEVAPAARRRQADPAGSHRLSGSPAHGAATRPECLEIVVELPHTPSGKIQKFKLRDIARTFGQG